MELVEFLPFTILLLATVHSVCSLRCYNCSSIVDEKCGKEWKFVGSEAEKYEVECPKNATHCVKHITFPLINNELSAFRGCWVPWENHTITRKPGCMEVGKESEVCVCKDSSKPCNSVTTLTASVLHIFFGSILSLLLVFCKNNFCS